LWHKVLTISSSKRGGTASPSIHHEWFETETNFGAKFCYGIDKPIQMLLDKMTKWRDAGTEGTPDYLTTKARELMEAVERGSRSKNHVTQSSTKQEQGHKRRKGDKTSAPPASPGRGEESEKPHKRKGKTPAAKATSSEVNFEPKSPKTPTTASHTNPSVRISWKPPIA
jgi:hypothetical protein